MATNTQGQAVLVTRAQQLGAGVAKHMAGATVVLSGTSTTSTEIGTKLQQVVSLRADVNTAKATASAKIATEAAATPALRALMDALTLYVKATYGSAPDILADFGLRPKVVRTQTAEQKAAAAVKRVATRAARGTKGSQQKKAIKGDVTGITVTPITVTTSVDPKAPAAASSGAAPAATAAPVRAATP